MLTFLLDEHMRRFNTDNVSIRVYESTGKYKASIKERLKEKGQEDIYVVNLSNMEGWCSALTLEIPKSVYEDRIGNENNIVTMASYSLSIYYKVPKLSAFPYLYFFRTPYMRKHYSRCDLLGGEAYTEQNSKALIQGTLRDFAKRLDSYGKLADINSTEKIESNVDWTIKME